MDIAPDLTMLGKIIGGGFPVGAIGGGADLMLKIFDPADMKVFHTGTFNANPVTMVAGEVSLRELTAERIERMDRTAPIATVRSCRRGEKTRVAAGDESLWILPEPLLSASRFPSRPLSVTTTSVMDRFHIACINRGLFIAPRGMIALSTVIGNEHIVEAIERADMAMQDVAAEIDSR